MITAVDEGYCQNNHCHCTPGFVQLEVPNEVTGLTKSVCAATCPAGTAWLSWLDKCVVASKLLHSNYSDGGAITRPDQTLICVHSTFLTRGDGCVCDARAFYVETIGPDVRETPWCSHNCSTEEPALFETSDHRNCISKCPET